ncbi:hypothetical protein GYMLUDRAFT_253397 [Collybiopsis luxurians FD-317 M1]|uniref:Uncharacterized protein n=1 Tax=Collybiopsis luxurians FD-317 M1 TaxID=944289 RepID=A0A0D0B7D1_9AGAR|nr:hypothetical protein GYMLUDRAFT_253397 [Collybiopsis luxurians FD-317 M1]
MKLVDTGVAKITGFTMYRVYDCDDLEVPANPADVAVAVIQGVDVGYFSSWFEALPHVLVLGALYSFHNTLHDAQLSFMRALLKNQVCFLYREGLLEAAVTPIIPSWLSMESWWCLFWTVLKDEVPPIDPVVN